MDESGIEFNKISFKICRIIEICKVIRRYFIYFSKLLY